MKAQKGLAVTQTLLFFSGMTALVYESLWMRVVSLGVGSTSKSMGIVLSVFFLGLGLGSFFSGKINRSLRSPFLFYGSVEIGLGVLASLWIGVLYELPRFLMHYWPSGTHFLPFLLALLLLIPTFLMGMGLPLLLSVAEEGESMGKKLGRCYAWNTLGGVVGVFLTGYFLVPRFGMVKCNLLAAIVNCVVGIGAVAVGLQRGETFTLFKPVPGCPPTSLGRASYADKILLVVTAIAGFVSISSEVLWAKYLNLYLGSNFLGTSLVLALFLLGIALGSYVYSLLFARIQDKYFLIAQLLSLAGFALLATGLGFSEVPRFVVYLEYFTYGLFGLFWTKCIVVALILLFPTVIFGMLFPLLVNTLSWGKENIGLALGVSYFANTVGSILGAYCTGIYLIPIWGSSRTLQGLFFCIVFCCGILLFLKELRIPRVPYFAVGAIAVVLCFQIGKLDFKNLIKFAQVQTSYPEKTPLKREERYRWLSASLQPLDPKYEDFHLVVEGENSVVSLSQDSASGDFSNQMLRLKAGGMSEAIFNIKSPDEYSKFESLLAYLPLVLTEHAQTAFVVGFGGGHTTDFLARAGVEKVTVVEIEKGIVEAVKVARQGSISVLQRPNVNLKFEDARFVLASRTLPPQDIIVSQPSHSWLNGASNLFTQEFFEIAKANLSAEGIFSQWLNLYNTNETAVKSVLKTFFTVFPHGAVFVEAGEREMVLVGSRAPIHFSRTKTEAIKNAPEFKGRLGQLFPNSSLDPLAMYTSSSEAVRFFSRDAKLNTDLTAFAEMEQIRVFYHPSRYPMDSVRSLRGIYSADYESLWNGESDPSFYESLFGTLHKRGDFEKMPILLKRMEQTLETADAAAKLGLYCLEAFRFKSAHRYLQRAFTKKADSETFTRLLDALWELKAYAQIINLSHNYGNMRSSGAECIVAGTYLSQRDLSHLTPLIQKILQRVSAYEKNCGKKIRKLIGGYFVLVGKPEAALPYFESYYAENPRDVANLDFLVRLLPKGDRKERLASILELERMGAKNQLQELIELFTRTELLDDAGVLQERLVSFGEAYL